MLRLRSRNSARESQAVEQTTFSNFETYAPSNDLPAAFVGSPVMHDGQFVGALMAQIKHSRLNSLVDANTSSSDDARVYLAGADGLLRAGSGFTSDEVLQVVFAHQSAEAALANRLGVIETIGFTGTDAMLAYTPLRWKNVIWSLVVENDRSTLYRSVDRLHRVMILAVLLCTVLAFLLGWFVADRPDESYAVHAQDAV